MENKYSVLMSVYSKEKSEYLRAAMESMFAQTVPCDEFVLVCDGPLNEGLDGVINEMDEKFGGRLRVIRIKENVGLGNALNVGIKECKNELIARMDSDDISMADRCEKQLNIFVSDPSVAIVSGTIEEFIGSTDHVVGARRLPETPESIIRYSRKRNPFNHPAVMLRKSEVEISGGYSEGYPLFEDYYLWIRMLERGYRGRNIDEPILMMRVSEDTYFRRGGKNYAENMLKFHKWMKDSKWTSCWDFLTGAIPHALICILPNKLRKTIYELMRHSAQIS